MSRDVRHPRWAWATLGIAETDDVTEIRRAYARKLKAIDPDADRQAFIDLQDARNLAFALLWEKAQAAAADGAQPQGGRIDEPEPAPPAEPPRDDAPILDPALFARIETMLFDAPGPPSWDELNAAFAALLADPALERVQILGGVESWVAATIVNSAPRSDPALDLAIERFGWDAAARDWRAPQVVDWILQRRADRDFEAWLAEAQPRYAALLALLRSPPEPPRGGPWAWRRAPEMWALLRYVAAHHPTVLAYSNREAVEWWEQYTLKADGPRDLIDSMRRRWRGLETFDEIFIERKELPGPQMVIAIVILPYLFAWFALRPVYHPLVRLAAGAWLALVAAAILFAPDLPSRPGAGPYPAVTPPPPPTYLSYVDPFVDLDPMVSRVTGGEYGIALLQVRNPGLHRSLIERWEQARRVGSDRATLDRAISTILRRSYRDNVRGGGYALQADYWRLFADELRWLHRSVGRASCDGQIRGRARLPLPAELEARERALLARALIELPAQPRERSQTGSFTIPAPVFAAGARRAGLSADAFDAALNERSTAERRCTARIALIEAALAMPQARAAPFLRAMSAGL